MTRRIVGNLDFEHDLAGTGALSAAAAARIAPLATLLRVFAEEGDRVWTPSPVDASLVPSVDRLPCPALESGPLERLEPASSVLAWGTTAACEKIAAACPAPAATGRDPPLHALLWALPRTSAEVARDVNDRRFFLEVARGLGTVLPGSGFFTELPALERRLATCESPRFVLKAPFSAAGRARVVFARDAIVDATTRERIETLLRLQGGALLEPWMERIDDLGALGLVDDRGVALLGLHRQHVTPEGNFTGITVRPFAVPDGLSKDEVAALTVTARRCGEALLERGYRGPFSVDSWKYRAADGKARLQPAGEINARMTMGLVARVAAQRVFGRGCMDEITLALDDEFTPESANAVVLLRRPRVVLRRTAIE